MLDTLVREISARWGLAEQGRPLVQMLVAAISNPATGGLPGFLDKFRQAGWGEMVNSWVGSQTVSHAPTTAQVEKVLGAEGGLLRQLSSHLGLPYDKVSAAVTGILPMLVERMTPDGSIPAVLPAEFASYAQEGQNLLGMGAAASAAATGAGRTVAGAATAATASAASASSGTLGKWLPWLIAALVVIFGVSYCSKSKDPVVAVAPATEPTPAPAPAPEPAPAVTPAPEPAPAASDASNATTSNGPSGDAAMAAPDGAGVLDGMHDGMPVLRVFFDTGKTDVATAFADKSKSLVEFLQANPDVKAVISGFNDPTGDPARNAELSKQRAQAVQSALLAQGVAADRTVLEKPAETTDAATSNAAARRVDVMLRR